MWLYENVPYEYDPESKIFGFIYEIENIKTGRKYIGRKYFTLAAYKQIKGKRKKIRKESDWKTYYGSSPALLEDVALLGKENFKRTILHFCKSKGECNYIESKEIFARDAVIDGNYYNGWVSCKVTSGHVRSLLFNQPEGDS